MRVRAAGLEQASGQGARSWRLANRRSGAASSVAALSRRLIAAGSEIDPVGLVRDHLGVTGEQRLALFGRPGDLLQTQQRDAVAVDWLERSSPASRPSSRIGVPGLGGGPLKATGNRRLRTRPRYFIRAVSSWPTKQPFLKSTPCSSSKPLSSRVERSTARSRLPSGTPSAEARLLVGRGGRGRKAHALEQPRGTAARQHRPARRVRPDAGRSAPHRRSGRAPRPAAQAGRAGPRDRPEHSGDLEFVAAVLDLDLGAQPIHHQPAHQVVDARPLCIEQHASPSCEITKSNRYCPAG